MNNIHPTLFFFVLAFSGAVIQSCSSEEDTVFPEISVSKPSVFSMYENGDTIRFEATVSDNNRIKTVDVILVDKENKPVLANISFTPSTNPFHVLGEYIIDDPMLPGGPYQLRFQASDGVNISNYFVDIQVHELNKEFKYPIIVTHPENGKWNAYRLDSVGIWQEFYTQTGDYIGSEVNSAAKQFYMCGISKSNLTALSLPSGITIWQVEAGIHQSQRWFEGIMYEYPKLYVSSAEGNIRAYDKTGSELYRSETNTLGVPDRAVLTKNLIISSFTDKFSQANYLIAFHNQGGLMIYSKFIQSKVACMVHLESDKVLVFSNNSAGQGIISVYDGADDSFMAIHQNYEGSFYQAEALDSYNYIVSGSKGLYWYAYDKNSLTPFVPGLINSEIKCDITSQIVYSCSGKTLNTYSFPFAGLIQSYSLPDTAVAIHLLYNK